MTPGTTIDTLHAMPTLSPASTKPEKILGIKNWVTPPSNLPNAAAVALAVPTTLGANMSEHQNWVVTKVAPTPPMKNRTATRPAPLTMKAAHRTGMAKRAMYTDCTTRGPNFSSRKPVATVIPIVDATEHMFAFCRTSLHLGPHTHISCVPYSVYSSQMPMESRTAGMRGASANHPTKVKKKDIVAAQNARACGLVCLRLPKFQMRKTVALSFSPTGQSN
mmetsp:Transcript_5235/g.14391  ORF Transcript_5235/g.14391 Transcript_5235/m.14391 type:complete len:220 (-) Transcript_5235:66-725(-)